MSTDAVVFVPESATGVEIDNAEVANPAGSGGVAKRQRVETFAGDTPTAAQATATNTKLDTVAGDLELIWNALGILDTNQGGKLDTIHTDLTGTLTTSDADTHTKLDTLHTDLTGTRDVSDAGTHTKLDTISDTLSQDDLVSALLELVNVLGRFGVAFDAAGRLRVNTDQTGGATTLPITITSGTVTTVTTCATTTVVNALRDLAPTGVQNPAAQLLDMGAQMLRQTGIVVSA